MSRIQDLINKAERYEMQLEYAKALNTYRYLIFFYEKDYYVYKSRAELYTKIHKYQKAIKDYEKAANIARIEKFDFGNEAYAHNKISELCYIIGDYERAILEMDKAVDLAPKNGDFIICYDPETFPRNFNFAAEYRLSTAYRDRAELYYKLGRYDEAIEDMKKSTEITLIPSDNIEFFNIYLAKEDYDKATEYLNLVEKETDIYLCKARLYKKQKNYDKAFKYYDKVINLDGIGKSDAFLEKAKILEEMGDYKSAKVLYDKYTKYTDDYKTRANFFFRQKLYDKAINDFNKSFRIIKLGGFSVRSHLDLFDDDAYFKRGISKCKIGKIKDGEKDIKKAIKINPNKKEYKNFLKNKILNEEFFTDIIE